MSKKKMSNGKFLAIVSPFAVLTLALGLTFEIVARQKGLASIFDTYLGKGAEHVTEVPGSEDWDTDYYDQTYEQSTTDGGNPEAKANAESIVEDICDEGMVLLKNNEGNALPISTDVGITLLGRGSVDPVYGGSGSGNVDVTTCANPKSGIEGAGFTVDSDAYTFFQNNYANYDRQVIVMDDYDGSTFFIGEIPASAYDFTIHPENVAVVFISRCGGEGLDLSTNLLRDSQTTASQTCINANANTAAEVNNYAVDQHELELSAEEKSVIAFAKANYSKVVVVLNESTTMEIGELEDDSDIDAIIWAGSPGSTGFNSLGKILSGEVNPSGRTPDLYSRDFTADPTWRNFAINGVHEYTGIDETKIAGGVNGTLKSHFVQYEEGIYVGYKYYETRSSIEGEQWYDDNVVYPFGYGLSYSTFSKTISRFEVSEDSVEIDVDVTNTSSVPGKEVVQLYFTAPYTNGGIEKSSTVLLDFGKTQLLAANESETIKFVVNRDDLASYDYKTEKAWVIESGTYYFEIKENSHEVSTDSNNNQLRESLTINETEVLDKKYNDDVDVTNRFDDLNEMFKDEATTGYATNMSRANFALTFPSFPTADDAKADVITIGGEPLADKFVAYDPFEHNDPSDVAPTSNQEKVHILSSFRGVAYDDEAYDELLDQLSDFDYADASSYLVNNAYVVKGIDNIGLSDGELHDGPQGWSTLLGGLANVCAYMSEPLLAATFNKELAKEMGVAIGEEALALKPRYNGWYGPAMNTHRSPFAGRNFEYYSEDGVLGGLIAASVVEGCGSKGLIPFIKHFVVNDQETWRTAHLATWVNEQALRENYLKPFELCVKNAKMTVNYLDDEGNPYSVEMKATTGLMSSFNYLGATWAGGREDLMHGVLRDEWGFRGVVSSDFNLYDYMQPDQGMRAGTDIQLTWQGFKAPFSDLTSATSKIAIRNAIHNLIYAMANSNALQKVAPGATVWFDMSPWRIWFYVAEGVLFGITVGLAAWATIRFIKNKKELKVVEE